MRPRVLVSHPSRQHACHLVYSLQEGGYLAKFITSVWYKPDKYPYRFINVLPLKLRKLMENEFKKRYYEKIDKNSVEQFPFFEIIREAFDRLLKGYKGEQGVQFVNRIHDWYVSKRIGKIKPDVVIGYEPASLKTFERVKKLGVITILDHASAHYKFIDELRKRFPEYDATFGERGLLDRVNRVKEEEFKYTDYVIALSRFAKETLISHDIPENKIYVLNLGFEPEKFRQKEFYRKDGVFKILYVGTITKRKGIHLLLEAYSQLNMKNAELILIGGITDGKDVLKKYEGMYKHIPYLNHEHLVSYYQDADVFILPSYLDSWAMVVIEAMACGTPVIISENTGAKEAVINGVNGFTIPVGGLDILKEKILFFYNNRDEVEYFGRNARNKAENYTWESYREKLREIVLEIWTDESTSRNPFLPPGP